MRDSECTLPDVDDGRIVIFRRNEPETIDDRCCQATDPEVGLAAETCVGRTGWIKNVAGDWIEGVTGFGLGVASAVPFQVPVFAHFKHFIGVAMVGRDNQNPVRGLDLFD